MLSDKPTLGNSRIPSGVAKSFPCVRFTLIWKGLCFTWPEEPLCLSHCDEWFAFRSLFDYSYVCLTDILGKYKYYIYFYIYIYIASLVFVFRTSDKLSHKLGTDVYISEQELLFS